MGPQTQPWSKRLRDESTSDVTFMVGREPDVWRFSAHSDILCQCSPVFHPMLRGNMAESGEILVPDVDGRSFDNLLNYVYTGQVELQSVDTALNTMYVADKYQVNDLMEQCIPYLQNNICPDTALAILQRVLLHRPESIPSAPPQDFDQNPCCSSLERHRLCARHHPHWAVLQALMWAFRRKADKNKKFRRLEEADDDDMLVGHPLVGPCLDAIDNDADSILNSENFEDAGPNVLALILDRDSLQATEVEVFNALLRWSISNCRRQKMEVTTENQREVLGRNLYLCRYLAMSEKDFLEGPALSDLLPPHVTNAIMLKFRGLIPEKLPKELLDHIPKLETPRQVRSKERRYSLSFRRKSISSKDKKSASEEQKKKKKKDKQCCKCQKEDKDKRKHFTSSAIAEGAILILATIFD